MIDSYNMHIVVVCIACVLYLPVMMEARNTFYQLKMFYVCIFWAVTFCFY